ncbi:copper resistance protein B, partial [Xanthomonas perforans]|nr:copper resistance protein B [Xanthomonas perforans]
MSRFRTQAWLAAAFLASASALAQEHQHDALEDAPQDMQDHAMQVTDGMQTTPASSQAAHMDHAHMAHAATGTGPMDDESMKHGSMGDASMHHQAM